MSGKPQSVKTVCNACSHQSHLRYHLVATNPFNDDETIYGCPNCQSINSFRMACDEPDCWEPVECGTPTEDGYRQTCREHMPGKKSKGGKP